MKKLVDNIALIGFMGSGKSTLGRGLAARLGFTFVDCDEVIIGQQGMNLTELFALHGEPFFRGLESELVSKLSILHRQVIATGGGLPLFSDNANRLLGSALLVYLETPFSVCYDRIVGDKLRPLVRSESALLELYESRQAQYKNVADIVIPMKGEIHSDLMTVYDRVCQSADFIGHEGIDEK